jgi:putative acetyltransferase
MPEILPLRPEQVTEARDMIWTVAHLLFNRADTQEESFALYATTWPLHDVANYQSEYVENGGAFLVLVDNGKIVGSGALRQMEAGVGEIKRLWLMPAYHGQGLGYRMMMELLTLAREKGYTKVRLQTSPAYQKRAYVFYRQLGFYEIPRYGGDPDDIGMELILDGSAV